MTDKENFPTLPQYWGMLNYFDWHYRYSDDHNEYKIKNGRHQQLKLISKQSPEKKELYEKFSKWAFSGETFGTTQESKPSQPIDIPQRRIRG